MKKEPKAVAPPKKPRLSRDEFLAQALDVLSREGESELRIDRLVGTLGVTKGSFYWHFDSRADFVRSLAEYWDDTSTKIAIRRLEQTPDDAMSRLHTLMELVIDRGLSRWDLVVRAWALHEPGVAEVVRRVDARRIETVGSLLRLLGFEGKDLAMRTRVFVTYFSFQQGLFPTESPAESLETSRRFLQIITQPSP